MNPLLTRRQVQLLLLAPVLTRIGLANAEDFPSRPLRLVLPVGAGGGADVLIRTFAEQLSAQIKQPVVVDNRPGADGLLAMQALLAAPADGYTLLLVGPQPMVFNPLLRDDLPYKVGDLQPVAGVGRGWPAMITGPNSRFTTFEDVIDAARKHPGRVTLGTDGLSFRVGASLLGRKLNAQFQHVPYKTFGQIFTDVAGGVLDVGFVDSSPTVQLSNSGKLRVLAIASKERLALLPQVPTIRERGIDFDMALWTALSVRTGTPELVQRKLETEIQKAFASKEVLALVSKMGTVELSLATGRSIAADVATETARYRDIVKEIAPELGVNKR